MAKDRDERAAGYHYYDDLPDDDRERRHRRRHRTRDYDDQSPLKRERERRDRRRTDDARRQAELDIDDLRAHRVSYYDRPDADKRRDQERMAQDIRTERARDKPRSRHRESKRDGSRRVKRREVVEDDRSDDYVYGRPKSRGPIEEITVTRSSARRRSEEGGSSSRTAYTPLSGSASTPSRRIEVQTLSR